MESGQKGGPFYDAPDQDSSSSHHFAVILESIKILRLRKRRGGGIRTIRAYVRLYVDDKEIPWLCSPNDRDTTDPSWKPCVLFTASYSTPLKFVVERVGHFVGREELATIEGPLSQFAFRDDVQHPLESDDSPGSMLQAAITYTVKPDLVYDVVCAEFAVDDLANSTECLRVLGQAIRGMQALGQGLQHVAKVHPIATVAVNLLKLAFQALSMHTDVRNQIQNLITVMRDSVTEVKDYLGGLDASREGVLKDILCSTLKGSSLIQDWSHYHTYRRWAKASDLIEQMDKCRDELVNHKRRMYAAFTVQDHQERVKIHEDVKEMKRDLAFIKDRLLRRRASESSDSGSDKGTLVDVALDEVTYDKVSDSSVSLPRAVPRS